MDRSMLKMCLQFAQRNGLDMHMPIVSMMLYFTNPILTIMDRKNVESWEDDLPF